MESREKEGEGGAEESSSAEPQAEMARRSLHMLNQMH